MKGILLLIFGFVFIANPFSVSAGNARTAADCSDLFISEYIDGTNHNKALEIFNPTSAPVNLSDYSIFKCLDGGTSTGTFGLTGTLAPGDVYVLANDSADTRIKLQADTLSPFLDFNGNDAVILIHLTDTIDGVGNTWELPADSGWYVDTASTYHHTLIRWPFAYHGDYFWNSGTTWRAFALDMFDSLGFHHMAPCGFIPTVNIHFIAMSDTAKEDIGTINAIVEVDNPYGIPVNFFAARDDAASTATTGTDFIYPNYQIANHTTGITFDTLPINVIDDLLIEPTETVVLRFINVVSPNTTVVQDSIFTLYIVDNDTLTFSFLGAGMSYVEDTPLVEVKVTISSPTDTPTSVLITLAPGSATNGADFTFNDTTIVFPPGTIDTQGVWIRIINDTIQEPNEQINLNLSTSVFGAHTGVIGYTVTIIDNDLPLGITEVNLDNSINMFPNPVSSKLNIQSENELLNADIFDITGNRVINLGKLPSGKNIVDVSSLAPGMYFMQFKEYDGVFSKRFVKTH